MPLAERKARPRRGDQPPPRGRRREDRGVVQDGIDAFFDNIGGGILDIGLLHLRRRARVVPCGAIARRIDVVEQPRPLANAVQMSGTMARMEAFFIYGLADEFARAAVTLACWIAAGRLHDHEDIRGGLAQMPSAPIRPFEGRTIGKQPVRVDPEAV